MSYEVRTRKYYLSEVMDGVINHIEELGYLYYPSLKKFNQFIRDLD